MPHDLTAAIADPLFSLILIKPDQTSLRMSKCPKAADHFVARCERGLFGDLVGVDLVGDAGWFVALVEGADAVADGCRRRR